MAMSDKIEAFIIELLKEDRPQGLEIGRNELAGIFNCVPSQINYVISTRFSPEKGYLVESRRGGGGYIRIKRINDGYFEDIKSIAESIAGGVSKEKAERIIEYLRSTGRLDKGQALLARAAVLGEYKEEIRSEVLKNILEVL